MSVAYDLTLFDGFQHEAVQFIEDTPFCALWADMRTGKTAITLTAFANLQRRFETSRALVIAPLKVSENAWPDEIPKWKQTSHLTFVSLVGLNGKKRLAETYKPHDICITTRDSFHALVDLRWNDWPWDMIIVDESSSFKTHNSRRFKAAITLLPKVTRMVQLTGTPASESLIALWPQMYLLDQGKRLGKNITTYRERFFTHNPYAHKWDVKSEETKQYIYELVADLVLRIDADDHGIGLSEVRPHTVRVPMTPELMAGYHRLEEEFVLKIEELQAEVVAFSTGALTQKLQQYCNGALYDAEKNVIPVHDLKIEALKELVARIDGNVLIAYAYQSDIPRILDAIPGSVWIKEKDAVRRWQRGEIPALVGHPASMGHGLTMHAGGNHLIWFGHTWSLELYDQMSARLVGRHTPTVESYHLVVPDTIEDEMVRSKAGKAKQQDALMRAVQAIRNRVGASK